MDLNPSIQCSNCKAICCRLEVQLIDDSDEQVPMDMTEVDDFGRAVMKRGEDGWCVAVDRSSHLCTIYNKRPFLCREYEAGAPDCVEERGKFTSW